MHEIPKLERIDELSALLCTRAKKLYGDERNFDGSARAHDHIALAFATPQRY